MALPSPSPNEGRSFYEKFKTNSACIRFLMMTGVTKLTKLTKLSVFSGLNHLTDLSMDSRYATLLGYTPEELDGPLGENVEALGDRLGISREAARAKILEWYDGYRFSPQSERRVINPVSFGKLFSLYAQVPPDWRIANEAEAKRYFQLFMSMCGANPAPEFPSVRGYADAVIETPDNVFVFEFKYNKSSKSAMRQIRERGYADKWKGGPRPVTLIGVNFSSRKRNIDIPEVEVL